jgi:hypothetical protein
MKATLFKKEALREIQWMIFGHFRWRAACRRAP